MKSIFNPADNAEIIDRIDKLTPSSAALWGKMNAGQMLAHCQVIIKIPLGEVQSKRGLEGFLFGRIAKKQVLSDQPIKTSLPTFKWAKITDQKNFDTEKLALTKQVKNFLSGPEIIKNAQHPFFGPLTIDEWDILQVKHLDHHLRQFGV